MRYELEQKQFEAFQYLLNYGRTQNFLSRDYRLFGWNQTKVSKCSPGVNVIERIKNLPEFSACGETGTELFGKDTDINWNFKKALKWSETYEFLSFNGRRDRKWRNVKSGYYLVFRLLLTF